MVDPIDQQLVVVTKEAAGTSQRLHHADLGARARCSAVTTLSLGLGQLVTAGDISASGDTIVLRTYTNVWVWTRRAGESLATTLARAAVRRAGAGRRPGRGARADAGRRRLRHRERGRGQSALGGRGRYGTLLPRLDGIARKYLV